MAPAAVVAPFDHAKPIRAAALEWLIRGHRLAVSTIAGALILAASGIMIVLREAARSR